MRPFLWLAPLALTASAPAATPTAVFTLDAHHRTIYYSGQHPIEPQIRKLAESARITPGGAIYKLSIPPDTPPRDRNGGAARDELKPLPVTLALFRDLDETVYLTVCPALPQDGVPDDGGSPGDPSTPDKTPEPAPADIKDCHDVDAGQTFSVELELEEDRMQVVVRGRQLPFSVYRVQPKPREIGTPYKPEPSETLPPSGPPPSVPPAEGMAPQTPPQYEPPNPAELSAGQPSNPVRSDVPPASTSLQTGRLGVACDTGRALVFVDGAYIGACPVETPVVAGRHTVVVKKPGSEDWTREVRIEAGVTVRVRAGEH